MTEKFFFLSHQAPFA